MRPTFVHPSVFILNHRQLVDLAKLLENGFEVLLLQIPRNLPHEQLDGVGFLHGYKVEVMAAGAEGGGEQIRSRYLWRGAAVAGQVLMEKGRKQTTDFRP